MGTLSATAPRAKEIFAFEYDPDWLRSGPAQVLDPALQLFGGLQYLGANRSNFGLFLDSAPDRWGRFLMDRRARQAERDEGWPRQSLRESDYLLGVFDEQRMGALRFRLSPDGPFLDDNRAYASPPWTSLRELEQASLALEQPGAEHAPDYQKWLRMLIAPGGSLGGAHPKAGVIDPEGQLWIAKFPKRGETTDGGGWEYVTYTLARQAGVAVPDALARRFNTSRHTFLTRRFDRVGTGRVHFASAMTLLNRADGDDASNGTSYLELAELLMRQGAQTEADLEQLWRRIVFSICVSNADDHLRNHGFLLTPQGWALSPAYDMNPDPDADGLKLNISDADNAQDLQLAREVADYFRVKAARANAIIHEVVVAVRLWRDEAKALGLSASEVERMEPAFRVADAGQ
ncbi:MAG: type II toxin-antitoxin system HipA family toxin [Armatimonadota bacterium]|nr:type II toxin-antitoxin system HipA family toxin [Armatimonadota bacterium]